jgi:succinoglycan biosynthesis transport protein ExoP
VLVCAALGAAFAASRDKMYESGVTVAIFPDVSTQGFVPSDNLSALLGTYAQTVNSSAVRDEAETELGRPLQATISSTTEEGTGILKIFAEATTPELARDSADAVGDAFLSSVSDDDFISAQIVDPAQVPTQAVQPRPPLIIGTSIVVGFGAAILLALAFERLRRRIETPADLAEVSALPMIAQIPRNRQLVRSRPRVVWDDQRLGDLQESFRSLRTNLTFVTGESRQVIQVTSATDGQGKSTVVANLAVAFSQIGLKTAVVDADLRRPVQREIFEIIGGSHAWTAAAFDVTNPWTGPFENLSVFPAGAPFADPTELLHTRFAPIVQALRETFDIVIVDSTPLLPVSDARIIAPWVDGIVLVVAAGRERPDNVNRAIHELTLTGARVQGLVLNQAQTAAAGGYYRHPDALVTPVDQTTPAVVPASRRRRRVQNRR